MRPRGPLLVRFALLLCLGYLALPTARTGARAVGADVRQPALVVQPPVRSTLLPGAQRVECGWVDPMLCYAHQPRGLARHDALPGLKSGVSQVGASGLKSGVSQVERTGMHAGVSYTTRTYRMHPLAAGAATLTAATATPSPTATPAALTPVPATPTPGGQQLLDESFTGQSTAMPLTKGQLALDSAGYELYNKANDPDYTVAYPQGIPALSSFAAEASLTLVKGDSSANYGLQVTDGASAYDVLLDPRGQIAIQREQQTQSVALLNWTASAAIHQGLATDTLSATYAGGLLQVSVNGVPVAFAALPGVKGSVQVGLLNYGGSTDTQVRCTRFRIWTGPSVVLDDRFQTNAAAWDLGPTFSLGQGQLQLNPPGQNGDPNVFPLAVPPTGAFSVLATITKLSGDDTDFLGGIGFLNTASAEFSYEITGSGTFAVNTWTGNGWQTLVTRSSAALKSGNVANTLFARYDDGTLVLGANGVVIYTMPLSGAPPVGQVGLLTEGNGRLRSSQFLLLQPASTLPAALDPPPPLRVQKTVYTDTFADNHNKWYVSGKEIWIGQHALHIDVHEKNAFNWSTEPRPLGADYSVSATMRLLTVSTDNNPYGLVFQNDESSQSGEFFVFEVTPDGSYHLAWYHHGTWQKDILPFKHTDVLAQGTATNRLRVDVLGQAVALYLNGVQLANAHLPVAATGRTIGFESSTGSDLAVSSVQVTALAPSAAPVVLRPVAQPTPVPLPTTAPSQSSALQRVIPSVVRIQVASAFPNSQPAYGSGVVILSDATGVYILTAHHVVKNVFPGDAGKRITVSLAGKHPVPALAFYVPGGAGGISAQDTDMTLIKLAPQAGFPAAPIGDSAKIQNGNTVVAIGYPDPTLISTNSAAWTVSGTVEDPSVSVPNLPGSYVGTSSTLTEGMSGGPLIFADTAGGPSAALFGTIVGIDVDYLRPKTENINANLAVPSAVFLPILRRLLAQAHPGPYTLPH